MGIKYISESKLRKIIRQHLLEETSIDSKKEEKPRCVPENVIPLDEIVGPSDNFKNYTNSLNGIIVKFWNVYGIEKDESKFHVISDFIKMALTKGHINVRTSGIELRDFLYADDCCQGLVKIMEEYDELDHAQEIHLAKFEWTSIAELAALISRKLNVDFTLGEDQDTVQANIRNEPSKYFLNYWLPKISLNDGVDKIINYFLTSEKIHS